MREPADHVLFFTDGVVEARSAAGSSLASTASWRMVTPASVAATPAAETMRRLVHAILDHQ